MSKLIKPFTAVLFGLFVFGVAGAVLFYSFKGLGLIFPNDLMGQILGMMLFDLAAFVWFMVFISKCESTMQYVFSIIGFLVGLAGTLGLVGIEVGLSSGMLEEGSMQKPLTYIFIGVMIGHLVLIYAHKAAHPVMAADISLGVEKAKITDQAEKDASKMLTDNIQALSQPIANELVKQVMNDLNLRPTSRTVLDLPALNVEHVPAVADSAARVKPLDFLKGWWNKKSAKPRTYEKAVSMRSSAHVQNVMPDLVEGAMEADKRKAAADELSYHPIGVHPARKRVLYDFPSQVGKVEMTAKNKPVVVVVDEIVADGGRLIVWEFNGKYIGKYANSDGDVWSSFWQTDLGLATRQPQQFSQFSKPNSRVEDEGNEIFRAVKVEEKPTGEDASFQPG